MECQSQNHGVPELVVPVCRTPDADLVCKTNGCNVRLLADGRAYCLVCRKPATYKVCRTDGCNVVIHSGIYKYDYCLGCLLEFHIECTAPGCYQTILKKTHPANRDINVRCEECHGQMCADRYNDADTGVKNQYEKTMACASNRDGSEEPTSESEGMMAYRCVEKENDMLGLTSVVRVNKGEVSLKRRCEEEEMPDSKRVCVPVHEEAIDCFVRTCT
tara:strand:- start:2356 stop:3006 length:651 start_codon:yes stop_codon:yes gene_type:complete